MLKLFWQFIFRWCCKPLGYYSKWPVDSCRINKLLLVGKSFSRHTCRSRWWR